eukprot:TRINITY_DN10338_c0_g1_i1.p1 TRINITY_DN10338_c0_g1~~TRINITY_DN10338_c0_g1_i1.p1  ORF type:complete len:349 (-),score=63.36 TRINITY_DN10338_c0_g1_i1:52-1098(-)
MSSAPSPAPAPTVKPIPAIISHSTEKPKRPDKRQSPASRLPQELSADQQADLRLAFQLLESDDVGTITPQDLTVALRALGLEPPKDHVKRLLHTFDKESAAGALVYDEFSRILASRVFEPISAQEIAVAFPLFADFASRHAIASAMAAAGIPPEKATPAIAARFAAAVEQVRKQSEPTSDAGSATTGAPKTPPLGAGAAVGSSAAAATGAFGRTDNLPAGATTAAADTAAATAAAQVVLSSGMSLEIPANFSPSGGAVASGAGGTLYDDVGVGVGYRHAPPPNVQGITRADLSRMAVELGEGVSDAELDEMFAEADADKDGVVSLEEFVAILTSATPTAPVDAGTLDR